MKAKKSYGWLVATIIIFLSVTIFLTAAQHRAVAKGTSDQPSGHILIERDTDEEHPRIHTPDPSGIGSDLDIGHDEDKRSRGFVVPDHTARDFWSRHPNLYIDYNFKDFHDDDFMRDFEDMMEQFEQMQKNMDSMFERWRRRRTDPFSGKFRFFQDDDTKWYAPWRQLDIPGSGLNIRADIQDTGNAYIVTCDIPGMDKDQINITFSDNVLTIEGNKETLIEKQDDRGNILRQERSYGSFSRTFVLPGQIKQDQIKSTYKDGVLTIILPKAEPTKKPKPRKIPIDYI